MNLGPLYNLQLPWSLTNDDERFKRILIALLLVYLLIALPVIFIKLPELTREEKEQLPPQLARIMLEKQELPASQLIEQPTSEQKAPETKKSEIKQREIRPETTAPVVKKSAPAVPPTNVPETRSSAKPSQTEAVAEARERAANSGLLQFKDDLAEMRESLQTSAVTTAATNQVAGAAAATAATSGQVDRSVITSGVSKGSGGVNTAAYSRDTGGTALAQRAATKVKSDLAEASKKAAGSTAGVSAGGSGDGAARSDEDVRKTMQQHMSALLNIYNKALRDDATLQGKVIVKMVIDPDGRVVDATIVSSELKNSEVESKLLQRIRLISFSPAKVIRTTLNYTFDFVPQ